MSDDLIPPRPQPRDIKERPSRARYDKVKTTLDLKWRRRQPQAERLMREVVDTLWNAFMDAPWTSCGIMTLQPDGLGLQPGPGRPLPGAARPLDGLAAKALSTGQPAFEGGEIAVPIYEKSGKTWAVFEAKSSAPFEDMDARWIERLLKPFNDIDKPFQRVD
jgi:hypothetical protein